MEVFSQSVKDAVVEIDFNNHAELHLASWFPKITTEIQRIARLKDIGLLGLEVYHSDHDAETAARYLAIARQLGLAVTGGSDYHGEAKPNVRLATGRHGNVRVPYPILTALRALGQPHHRALGHPHHGAVG